jgi:hypothetical protein
MKDEIEVKAEAVEERSISSFMAEQPMSEETRAYVDKMLNRFIMITAHEDSRAGSSVLYALDAVGKVWKYSRSFEHWAEVKGIRK